MRGLLTALAALAAAAALGALPGAAQGAEPPPCAGPPEQCFGLHDLELRFEDGSGQALLEAGAHPDAMVTRIAANTIEEPTRGVEIPNEDVRDLVVWLAPGLVGSPFATPRCSTLDFASGGNSPNCPESAKIGVVDLRFSFDPDESEPFDVYNIAAPPGMAAKLGFAVHGVRIVLEVGVNPNPPYNVVSRSLNVSQALPLFEATLTVLGKPGGRAFLTLPRACTGPLSTTFQARSWQRPATWLSYEVPTRDGSGAPRGFLGCEALELNLRRLAAQPTNRSAESPSGLAFELEVEDPGLTNSEGRAGSDIKRAVVSLPRGVTLNPAQAEGLGVCTEAELARERADSAPGEGCPQSAKVGTVEVQSELLENDVLDGELFVAEPYHNRFGTLLALFMTVKSPKYGVIFRLAGKIEPDPRSGRLRSTFDDLPQWPVSEFRLRLREGARSPLVTPPACGTYRVEAELTPWAQPDRPVRESAAFEIQSGVGGGPCPPPGPPPHEPGFEAGTLNNNAKSFSPFAMRLTRRDGDQDLTRFDAVLPPGVTARLAGVPWCPEAAIARARGRDGKDERRSPSCPAASRIGSVQGGAGVGSQLTYVPGKVYLAGPVGGAPISVVGIVPAVAGPFDVGTIVVRQALDLDPITGQAKVVSSASDALPHILAGIPLRVRDIQVNVNRPDFTLNPTSCNPMAVLAGIWGGGSDVFSGHDDFPVLRQARFQAASCASLGFEPRLAIKLRGGVKRGAHPALRAHVRPRPGDANFSRAVVTLPRSAFLDQAHIRTICTRVQFAAGAGHGAHCPPGARYGFARAWSPLLDGPVSGPVYLRSSDNNLPDLVAALTGPPSAQVQVELSARIDSVKGGIRSTFAGIPDLPVSRFLLDMQGGKKGLIVNSRHLCHKPGRNRAKANIRGQNGKVSRTRPRVIATTCQKRRKAKRSAIGASRASATK